MGQKEELIARYSRYTDKKKRLLTRLQVTYDMIAGLPKNVDIFMVRAEKLEELFTEFNSVIDVLASIQLEEATLLTDCVNETSTFENLYFSIVAASKRYTIPTIKPPEMNTSCMSNQPVHIKPKLPEIQLAKFDGQIQNFSSFISLFDALIHESNLSDVEKFTYLLANVEGPALQLIKTVEFRPENYTTAYQTLVNRYTNKRVIANFYLNKLLTFTPLKSDAQSSIRNTVDFILTTVASLKSLNIPDISDFLFLHLGLRLMDFKTKRAFEDKYVDTPFPTFKNFEEFMSSQSCISDLINTSVSGTTITPSVKERKRVLLASNSDSDVITPSSKVNSSTISTRNNSPSTSSSCLCCSKSNHKLSKCEVFLSMNVPDRKMIIQQNRLCFACFGRHTAAMCKSTFCCRICKKKTHNHLLHQENKSDVSSSSSHSDHSPTAEPSASNGNAISLTNVCPKPSSTSIALLGTAKATILDVTGRPHTCRLVLDSGSQANFITSSLADRLGLPRKKCSFDISGVGHSTVRSKVQGLVSFKLISRHSPESAMFLDAAIISRITSDLPTTPLSDQLLSHFSFLTLADPEFHTPGSVDILLGVQAVLDVSLEFPGTIKGNPSAVPTIFGFVLMGSLPLESPPDHLNSLLVSSSAISPLQSLDETMRAFWEQEEVEIAHSPSEEDMQCERHFQQTISRDSTGRYIARLPFMDNIRPILGSTRDRALKRFFRLEKQFEKNPEFRDLYHACLKDYVHQGHMIRALTPTDYVMTHHGVVKGPSDNLKVRVVFNPSENDPTGTSLNDTLLVGPKRQGDIGEIISRFRTHKVALTCDVRQMYRAINLHPDDQEFLHFFWRFSPSDPVTEWQLTTVTFGVTSSPFTAQRTLAQLVQDEGEKYPLAADALRSETYIDDITSGANSDEEAVVLQSQLTELLKLGGFELGKWASSSSTLLSNLSADVLNFSEDHNSQSTLKVLGIGWDPKADVFCCKIDPTSVPATKRGILSKVARMFDPNGYFSPVIFSLKALLQQIWLLKIGWDDPIPPLLLSTWENLEQELPLLEQIHIPRCILPTPYLDLHLIGFSDASELGMAAVLYLRIETLDGVHVHLVKSKTKVAPLKSWTIPRLELGAAHLLAKLIKSSKGFIEHLSISKITCFTDATTILAWLRTPPYRLKTFVSNRVVQIHDACPLAVWRHVSGTQNPADVGSRGMAPSKLIEHEIWWKGPPFLYQTLTDWPSDHNFSYSGLPELKEPTILNFLSLSTPSNFIQWVENSSSLLKLQRIVAYVLRFIHNSLLSAKNSSHLGRRFGPISASEYRDALSTLVRVTQAHHFGDEIALLEKKKECSKRLATLSPFLSPDGFLRVGGRLAWAPLSEKAKRPLLIPKESHLARLLVDHYHLYSAHGGPRLVQSLLHREYWITSARSLIRQRLHKCVRCTRHTGTITNPFMADLPKSRLSPGKCFTHTGLDFGGPFHIRLSSRRNAKIDKGYFALFVCMSTRAVHIEVVSALSTEACLASIDRFIARRGLPSHFYSDNGRNFRGAAREISEIHHFLKQASPEFEHFLAKREITWIFNPPIAPNFGGAWEIMIKGAKHHLKRIIGDRILTFEEYATVFARIEAILNSRPLIALPGSPNDPADCLTPGHFLVGGPLIARPEADLLDENPNRLKRWQMLTQLTQSFWLRWSKEYLHSLQLRTKWNKKTPELKDGAVVIIRSPNTSPTQWPLGRVDRLLPGAGGVVRVARVRTSTGVLTRPTNKLVVLPVE